MDWIEEYGEAYLACHVHLGSTNAETEALLKEHYEFRNRAKVSPAGLLCACFCVCVVCVCVCVCVCDFPVIQTKCSRKLSSVNLYNIFQLLFCLFDLFVFILSF